MQHPELVNRLEKFIGANDSVTLSMKFNESPYEVAAALWKALSDQKGEFSDAERIIEVDAAHLIEVTIKVIRLPDSFEVQCHEKNRRRWPFHEDLKVSHVRISPQNEILHEGIQHFDLGEPVSNTTDDKDQAKKTVAFYLHYLFFNRREEE